MKMAIFERLAGGSSRSQKVFKNIIGIFLLKGVNALVGFVMVPIAYHYLDKQLYGVWLTMSGIFTWVSFLDIGMGHGLRNRIAEAMAKGESERARSMVSTAYLGVGVIFLLVFIVFAITNQWLDWRMILNSSSLDNQEMRYIALMVFLFFCLRFIFQIITSVSYGMQEPVYAQIIEVTGRIISLTGVYIATTFTEGSMFYLGLALSAGPVLAMLIYSFGLYFGRYRMLRPSLRQIRFEHMNSIIRLGVKFFVLQICAIIIYQSNNIIIAHLFGSEQVTTFNIGFQYFSIVTILITTAITPLWSAVTDAFCKDDYAWLKSSFKQLTFLSFGFVAFSVVLYIINPWLINLWMRQNINLPDGLMIALAVFVGINAYNAVLVQFINGMGKVKVQFYFGLLIALVHIPVTIYFCSTFELKGVIYSGIITGIIACALYSIQIRKLFAKTAHGIWNR